MKACKVPCPKCPFRKDSMKGFLGGYTPVELHRLVMNEQPFPCHMTLPEVDELSPEEAAEYPLCSGSLAYMKKCGKLPRNPELETYVASVPNDSLRNILSMREFLEYHKPITNI